MIPLFSVQQVKEADTFAVEQLQIPSVILMENAALSIYKEITEFFGDLNPASAIGIICGKGNNGGDGFTLARHFCNNGFKVIALHLADENELKGDALINFQILKNLSELNDSVVIKRISNSDEIKIFDECFLVIDAILGTGARGQLEKNLSDIIKEINKGSYKRVAVDIPTGLNVVKGTGETVFNSDLTISLGELKTGLFYGKGYKYSGKVKKGSIGIGREYFKSLDINTYLIEPEDAYNYLPLRSKDIHKYSSGKILLIAGSADYPGAAAFTANAAHKIGAGSVILAVPESIKNIVHSKIDISVVKTFSDNGSGYLQKSNINELSELFDWCETVVIGPGLGRKTETLKAVKIIIENNKEKNFVIDADAIYALSENEYKRINLENCIITPHHKELSELLNVDLKKLQGDIIKYGSEFISQTKCILVLKGAPTIIFLPDGDILINSSGNSGMAKFATGDVLTGILGGLVAQNNNMEQSAICGVYLHSFCSDLLSYQKTEFGYTALDIIDNLPNTLKFLHDTFKQDL